MGESSRCLALSALAHGVIIASLCAVFAHGRPAVHPSTQIVMVVPAPEPSAPIPVMPAVQPPEDPIPVPAVEPQVAEEQPAPPVLPEPVDHPVPAEPAVAGVPPPEQPVASAPEPAALPADVAPVLPAEPVVFVPPCLLPDQNLEPEYPYAARRAGHEGVVLLHVKISDTGGVAGSSVAAGCGDDSLDASALSAVTTWKFSPARRGPDPVASEIELPIRFTLRSRESR